jgi:excisionase family DNA binding protein
MASHPEPAIDARLLRTGTAARYVGLGKKALRQLIIEGELPFVQLRPGNSPFLLDVRDLDRFIEMHKTRLGVSKAGV